MVKQTSQSLDKFNILLVALVNESKEQRFKYKEYAQVFVQLSNLPLFSPSVNGSCDQYPSWNFFFVLSLLNTIVSRLIPMTELVDQSRK